MIGGRLLLHGYPWPAVGHVLPDSMLALPGLPRNVFGEDFVKFGWRWTSELCHADSDGDGLTNGEEVGDPDCVWQQGDPDPPLFPLPEIGGHPAYDERRSIPPDVFHELPFVPQIRSHRREASSSRKQDRGNMTKLWHDDFYRRMPNTSPSITHGEPAERALFFLVWLLIPTLVILAALLRHTSLSPYINVKLSWVLFNWFWLFSGIAIGFHRLFSHRSFEPSPNLRFFLQVWIRFYDCL